MIGTRKINGIECNVDVSLSMGQWYITPPTEEGKPAWTATGERLDEAVAKARHEINKRKVKIAVDYRTAHGDHGVATGLHGGTGNIIVRVTDPNGRERTEQIPGYRTTVFRPDTPDAVLDEIRDKQTESSRLRREAERLENAHQFNLNRAVEAAVEEAARAVVEG